MLPSQLNVIAELEPVLLELGKALFICQAFEGTLVMLLSTISHEEANAAEGAYSDAAESFSQKTLGQLLQRLRKQLVLSEELNANFVDGWNYRNWVVHEFLHKCIIDLQTPKGRLLACTALVDAKHKVKLADIAANKILDLYLKKYGLSVAQLKANADRQWDHLNPSNVSPLN